MNRNLAHLGMAKKAGLLAIGSEAAAVAARRGETKLIITASDASEASVRRAKNNAESNEVPYIAVPFSMFELGQAAGRGSPGTIAFLDKGLADGFKKRLAEAKVQADTADSRARSATSAKESDA